MKKTLFLYLFIFTALLALFLYVNQVRVFNAKEKKLRFLEDKIKSVEASNNSQSKMLFNLLENEEAITYFELQGLVVEDVIAALKESLYEANLAEKGNCYLPDIASEYGTYKINSVHFLNHRWVIANFTDGKQWGEILFRYFVTDTTQIDIEIIEWVLLPN